MKWPAKQFQIWVHLKFFLQNCFMGEASSTRQDLFVCKILETVFDEEYFIPYQSYNSINELNFKPAKPNCSLCFLVWWHASALRLHPLIPCIVWPHMVFYGSETRGWCPKKKKKIGQNSRFEGLGLTHRWRSKCHFRTFRLCPPKPNAFGANSTEPEHNWSLMP